MKPLRLSCTLILAAVLPYANLSAQSNPPANVTISGLGTDVDLGWAVAPAGDVNGDGVTDLIVGDPSNNSVDQFAGRAYLFLGPLTSDIDTSKAVATISAESFGDNLGFSVASAGDVNGDGFDDILIGARSNDDSGIQAGRVYLFYGPVTGSLTATNADAIIEGVAFAEIGRVVAGLGDINGDGFADVAVGSDIAGGQGSGEIFIFNGPLSGTRSITTADATITGGFPNESFGASIASVGDLNGDGVSDIIVGASRFPLNGAGNGSAYIFFGPVTGSLIDTQADVIISGEALNDDFGVAVAGGTDVNGDGVPDVIVGADQLYADSGAGKAYVFYGPLRGNIQAGNADAILTGEVDRDLFGAAVASAGDLNGDGFADVTVGAWNNASGGIRSGRTYTFFGPLSGNIAASSAGSIVTGSTLDQLGLSVAGGDFNGDGAADLMIGAPQFANNAHGYAALYFGTTKVRPGITVTLTPKDNPIIIPATGGSFRFRFKLSNSSSETVTASVQVRLTGPGTNRTLAKFSETLDAGKSFKRSFTISVPGSAQPGTYTVTGSASVSHGLESSDSFTLEKSAQ